MASKSDLTKPSLSEIIPGLFIGNELSTYDEPTLVENHITAVVSLVYAKTALWQRSKFNRHIPQERHLHIGCKDSSTQDLLKNMDTICDFIDRMMRQKSKDGNGTVLVHCSHGISRSAAAVIAYLMRKDRIDFATVLDQVRAKRPLVKPSANFTVQLEIWEQLGYRVWEDEAKRIPKKAYADWLDQRLTLCKKKGLTGNEPDTPQDLSDLSGCILGPAFAAHLHVYKKTAQIFPTPAQVLQIMEAQRTTAGSAPGRASAGYPSMVVAVNRSVSVRRPEPRGRRKDQASSIAF